MSDFDYTEISLIDSYNRTSPFYKGIVEPINTYLEKNKGAVSDFNLIKDIVDRSIDQEEDDISSNLPIPLYLGLAGTMLGIIIGLIFTEISSDDLKGVDSLLNGVKFAMVSSVLGLLFTTFNSLTFYRVRKEVDLKKNHFFSFIQTRLLPILSKNTTSSLLMLQANLLKFNEVFTKNLSQFDSILYTVKESFDSQLQVLEELKRVDVSNIAKYNIEVMKEMQTSFNQMKKLSQYLEKMDNFLLNTNQLNSTVNEQLNKIGDIGQIIDNFNATAANISSGSAYLQSHFKAFDVREQAISEKLTDFDSNILVLLDSLKKSFHDRLQSFNETDIEVNSGFRTLFEELKQKTKEIFEDESQNIAAINKNVVELNKSINDLQQVKDQVEEVNKTVDRQDKTISVVMAEIANKPLVFNMPKSFRVLFYIMSIIVIITSIILSYKALL